ncbi:MAG: hypothetical protein KY475_25210, partial [Planctomycetes bacterium]|nr:hypothetical protein [Planctomycetota bacterium]
MNRCSTRGAGRLARRFSPIAAAAAALLAVYCDASASHAQTAQWIWAQEHRPGDTPPTDCHFRKSFQVRSPDRAMMVVSADDQFDLFVNGRAIRTNVPGEGRTQIDISRMVKRGTNVVAIRVQNRQGDSAGLAAQLMVQERGSNWTSHSTDETWRYSLNPFPFWNSPVYNDRGWRTAQTLGPMGRTAPFDGRAQAPSSAVAQNQSNEPAAEPAPRAAART